MTRNTSAISAPLGTLAKYSQTPKKAPKTTDVGQPEAALRRAVSGAFLGNTAKRPAIQQIRGLQPDQPKILWTIPDAETGEVLPFTLSQNRKSETVAKVVKTTQAARSERWSLKSVVHDLLPDTRMCRCHRWRKKNENVKVLLNTEYSRAFLSGLQSCGSVWGCPICAAKISERRRAELERAIEQAKQLGLQVMLLTLTIPHGMGDDVGTITDNLIDSWDSIKRNRAGRTLRDQIELVGTIRAMEVTYGANGFHPHLHILLFIKSDVRPSEVQRLYAPLWQSACVKQGLPRPSDRHGCKVDDGSKAAAYVAKGGWGLESEMTKGHTKTAGDGKGMTPWDMLKKVFNDGDEQAGRLFKVYYENFKGRRQLCWSKGLKAMLSVVDLSDEELAGQELEPATVLAELTLDQWRAIYKTKSESVILDVAEKNPDALDDLVKRIESGYKAKLDKGKVMHFSTSDVLITHSKEVTSNV